MIELLLASTDLFDHNYVNNDFFILQFTFSRVDKTIDNSDLIMILDWNSKDNLTGAAQTWNRSVKLFIVPHYEPFEFNYLSEPLWANC